MREVTFGGANSLDNYLARTDHAVDWLRWGDEAAAVMADYWKTIDTVLMGRKTYEVAVRSGQGGGGYPGMKTYVFSRTLEEGQHEGVAIIRRDAAEFVGELSLEMVRITPETVVVRDQSYQPTPWARQHGTERPGPA